MKLEEVIPLVGKFGRYQLTVVLYTGVLSLIGGMVTFGNVFFAAEADHWCRVLPRENCSGWPELQDNCTAAKRAVLLPPPENEDGKYPYSNCQQWDLPPGYEFDPYGPPGGAPNGSDGRVPCQDGWEYDTSQYKTTTISDFDLVCDRRGLPNLAQSIYFAGFMVGSLVCGSLSDWVGRKKTVVLALLLFQAGAIATPFSVNVYMYMAVRFFAGFGNMGFYIPIFVLVMEFVGDSWRTAATMALGIMYACGYFFLATAAMFVRDWRPLSMIVALLSVPLLLPSLFLQESVSWLISKGRVDEAEAVIRKIAKWNGKTLPDVLLNAEDIKDEMEQRTSVVPSSVIDLFKTPNMAAKTVNIMFNWLVNNLVYYGLAQSTGDLGVDEYWAFFVSGAVEIPALLYATFGVEWFGRKWNTAVLEIIAGVACLATIFTPPGVWRTAVAMTGKFAVSASYNILYLYTSELFPTPVRSIGVGMGAVAAQIAGMLSPIILLLADYAASLPYILFGSCSVVAGILVFLLPETKGRRLPQTLEEGEDIGKCRCMRRMAKDTAPVGENEEGALNLSNPAYLYTEQQEGAEIGV